MKYSLIRLWLGRSLRAGASAGCACLLAAPTPAADRAAPDAARGHHLEIKALTAPSESQPISATALAVDQRRHGRPKTADVSVVLDDAGLVDAPMPDFLERLEDVNYSLRTGAQAHADFLVYDNWTTETGISQKAGFEMGEHTTPYRLSFSRFFPKPNLPVDNPLTEEGNELGRQLFNDPTLSINDCQSCASCHRVASAFSDTIRFSVGAEGEPGTRNAMR